MAVDKKENVFHVVLDDLRKKKRDEIVAHFKAIGMKYGNTALAHEGIDKIHAEIFGAKTPPSANEVLKGSIKKQF